MVKDRIRFLLTYILHYDKIKQKRMEVYLMKRFLVLLLVLCIGMVIFSGCESGKGEEITIKIGAGERTGTYIGEMQNGVPHGQGKFTAHNPEGESWTYEGEFKNGTFDGKGKTTWASGQIEQGTYVNGEVVPMTLEEAEIAVDNPETHIGCHIEFVGKVFGDVEKSEAGTAFQVWTDPVKTDRNVYIWGADPDLEIEDGDYVKVKGVIRETLEGSNYFGATLKIAMVVVTGPDYNGFYCEKIDYKEAVMPTIKEIVVNKTLTQHGYSVTLQKIEFAEQETRVYLKVDNNGKAEFSLYDYYSKLVQGNKQYEDDDNWDADYPEIQTDLLPGCSTEGIIVFPTIDGKMEFKLIFEGQSDDYKEKFTDFVYNVKP